MSDRVRPAAVAGAFYPGSPGALRSTVEGLLAEVAEVGEVGEVPPGNGAAKPPKAPKAIIAPHAGYVYSGPIAASAFQALTAGARPISRVVILGPAHFVPIRGLALPGAEYFETPLGRVKIDPTGAGAVLRLPQVRVYPEAHVREHSLEVEIPFLQVLLGDGFTVIPLVVGEADGGEVAEVLERLWFEDDTVFVISSDLSHYLPYDEARRMDRMTADEILGLRGPLHPRQACGAMPINGLLEAARRRGLAPELLDLRNSADTAGDPSRVVGYGAFAFHERN